MFSTDADPDDPQLREAVTNLHTLFDEIVSRRTPERATDEAKRGIWCLVHGMSVLMSDDKITIMGTAGRHEWVKNTWKALLTPPAMTVTQKISCRS